VFLEAREGGVSKIAEGAAVGRSSSNGLRSIKTSGADIDRDQETLKKVRLSEKENSFVLVKENLRRSQQERGQKDG